MGQSIAGKGKSTQNIEIFGVRSTSFHLPGHLSRKKYIYIW